MKTISVKTIHVGGGDPNCGHRFVGLLSERLPGSTSGEGALCEIQFDCNLCGAQMFEDWEEFEQSADV